MTSQTLAVAVARFCAANGLGTAFAVTGGAAMHLVHAFDAVADCQCIAMHHEQAAAMAADGYARSSGWAGLAIATSGPGATNLITGIAGAFYDSVPVLFITGQVSTTRMVGATGVRQVGFQETPIVDMVGPVTKLAVQVTSAQRIRFELERALWTMREGRPGPVLVDIPDDLQRVDVVWEDLPGFIPPDDDHRDDSPLREDLAAVSSLLRASSRPVLVGGWGVHLAHAERQFVELVDSWGIPTVLTWGAADLLDAAHPLRVGTFGTHGSRHANFAVQNADLVIAVGSRLDTKATGSPPSSFARAARKVVVDLDPAELAKFSAFGVVIDLPIRADAGRFLEAAHAQIQPAHSFGPWLQRIRGWEEAFAPLDAGLRAGAGVDPYRFMRLLVDSAPPDADLFLDTGCLLPWIMQAASPSRGQRMFHDFNNTAMGWSLPALVGGAAAHPERPAAAVVGDGSLMMSMHELATLAGRPLPAKVVLIDNGGYSMIRQTQDQWMGSQYVASSTDGGLAFPEFGLVAEAFGFAYDEIVDGTVVEERLREFWSSSGDRLLRVVVSPDARVIPQGRFGRPLEDAEPLLPRDLFLGSMIVDPLDVSRGA